MLAPYKKRLADDLQRWQANGWITEYGRTQIANELARGGPNVKLAPALGILASVLFGFAAISFVAAHWQDIPRLARLAMLLSFVWAGYGAAGFLNQRGHPALADAAVLFAVAVFGASIMLVSQMYNIDGDPADGLLLWWVGALLAGAALRSNPAIAWAMILVCTWTIFEMLERDGVYWPFLIGWALCSAAFFWQQWRPGLHLSAIALSGFVVSLGYLLDNGHQHALVAMTGLVVAGAAVVAEKTKPELEHLAHPIFAYAVGVGYAGLFALQFFEKPSLGALIALAALTLVLLLAAISYGLNSRNRGAVWLGYIAFSAEVLWIYGTTIGSILGTSLFFLTAALIVTGLAYLALQISRRGELKERSP